ncbi:hypothetical protein [Aureispira sp. CCB-QB1]|uniref:hypothetical protein n=1 Tax=Aureispira sp. CCB-QB1 TaxID=1313421 RepID=UPI000698FC9E|nr:hypothetical protein [Aureispira sp. CCB-QB1]
MKYLVQGLIFLFITGCQPPHSSYNHVLVLTDITDTTITQQIDIESSANFLFRELLELSIDEVSNNGFSIGFSALSDRYENPMLASVELPLGNSMFTQITKERLENQKQAYKQIQSALELVKTVENQQKKSSNLYQPIVDAIKELDGKQGSKKSLIIFSDLMHHSHTGGSLYKDTTAFLDMVSKTSYEIPTNLEIIVVFTPKTVQQDKLHKEVIQPLWKKALKGTNIRFTTQL